MILLPRPAPHLPRTVAALHAAGLTTLHPLALSQVTPTPVTLPATATALILSSPLGVKALPSTSLPIYAVGPTTAQTALEKGFSVVFTGNTNGATLATAIAAKSLPPQHFVHIHGSNVTPPLPWYSVLETQGHTLTPLCGYTLAPLSALPESTLTTLRQNPPTHTLLFSPDSARHLANLLKQATLPFTGTAIALSAAVATVASPYWPQVVTAPNPTLEAMVHTLRHTTGKAP